MPSVTIRGSSSQHLREIPPDREDGSSSWVHQALIFAGRLGEIPPIFMIPLLIGLALLTSWIWPTRRWAAILTAALFYLLDWGTLALLPVKARSWGPVTPSLLGLALVRFGLYATGFVLRETTWGFPLVLLVQAALSGVVIYATWIEPFHVEITRESLALERWRAETPLRLLQISDVHFEGPSPREAEVLQAAASLQPDLILLTGDYLNLSSVYDPDAQAGLRSFLDKLEAPLGVYAITGSPPVDVPGIVPEVLEGLPVHWLDDEATEIRVDTPDGEQAIWLMGVRTTYRLERDRDAMMALVDQAPREAVRLLLYHTPDLMPDASAQEVDLYLCGHTHGGQIRFPLIGAIATSSRWGKRYEQGRYHERGTTLYVSRGLGLEGLGAPRARFLARPELILWELTRS
jgi:predicted MPP superfamily phosphohydrolase